MNNTAVISARVSEEFRDRLDRIALRLRARDRSSFIKGLLEQLVNELEKRLDRSEDTP